uniref:Ribosome biogenesis regulatory protein n=1 Tax=Evadne anonyx TaxID=141404 RepID=A0A9N6ZE83_9CRUS|nr:EOG090X0CBY [Evadne anonyx]
MAATIVQNVLDRAVEEEAEKIKSIQVDKPVELEIDAGNLLAYDINDIDINQLRTEKEKCLTNLARDNVQLLINCLFQLPTELVDNNIFVKLPPPTTRLPRAKPVPKAKQLTKWEKYAKEKGIVKRKKDNLEWDEELRKWVPRYGFKKSQAEKEKSWCVELPGNAKDDDDPNARRKTKKEEAVAKNELQRLRNLSARTLKSNLRRQIPGQSSRTEAKTTRRPVVKVAKAPTLKFQKDIININNVRNIETTFGQKTFLMEIRPTVKKQLLWFFFDEFNRSSKIDIHSSSNETRSNYRMKQSNRAVHLTVYRSELSPLQTICEISC